MYLCNKCLWENPSQNIMYIKNRRKTKVYKYHKKPVKSQGAITMWQMFIITLDFRKSSSNIVRRVWCSINYFSYFQTLAFVMFRICFIKFHIRTTWLTIYSFSSTIMDPLWYFVWRKRLKLTELSDNYSSLFELFWSRNRLQRVQSCLFKRDVFRWTFKLVLLYETGFLPF